MSGDEPPEFIAKMVGDSDASTFELHVLACILQNGAFAEQIAGVLCVDAYPLKQRFRSDEGWQDFYQDIANALYSCFRKHRDQLKPGSVWVITKDVLIILVRQLAAERHGVIAPGPEEAMVIELFDRVSQARIEESAEIVRLGFIPWLRKRRLTLIMEGRAQRQDWSAAEALEAIAAHNKAVDQILVGDEQAFIAFGEAPAAPPVEIIPTDIRALDAGLGGGFGKGEFSLIIAPSGGGKTVIATQLAATFALRGNKVLFITTEEPQNMLELRIISNCCHILYGKIRSGIDRTVLTIEEQTRIEKLRRSLGQALHFANWAQDRTRSIRNDLKVEIDSYIRKFGGIDALIFDWIGGALGELKGTEQHELRLAFERTGDALGDLAKEFGIVVIGFAQASISSTRNKRRIEQSDISECKSLGRAATNVIGLSAVPDEGGEDGPNIAPVQFLTISKARKSAGGYYRVRREFEYQKLKAV